MNLTILLLLRLSSCSILLETLCAHSRGASFFLLLPVTRTHRVYVHTGVNIARRVRFLSPANRGVRSSTFSRSFALLDQRRRGPGNERERERKSWRQGRKRSETQNERAPFSTRLYGCFRVSAAPGTSTSPGYMCGRLPYLLRPSNKPQTSSRGKRWHGIRLGWKGYSWEIRGESRGNSLSAALSSLWRRQRRRGNSPLSGDLREISFR